MPLYTVLGDLTNRRCYPLQLASTLATAITEQVTATKPSLTIKLATGAVFVANNYDPSDFTGFSTTLVVVTPGNLATQQTSNVTNTTTVSGAT